MENRKGTDNEIFRGVWEEMVDRKTDKARIAEARRKRREKEKKKRKKRKKNLED